MENEVLDYVMNSPENTNPAILKQMLDENSGTKLPEPTIEDNGKVLGVSNGSYALVNGGGGGGAEPLIVNLVFDETDEVAGIDASYNEIKAAVLAGKCVYACDINEGAETYVPLVSFAHQEIYTASFTGGMIFESDDADTDMEHTGK